MSKLDLGPVGLTVQVSADGSHLEEAAALEGLGYSAIWLRGGQIDNLSRIAEVVRATVLATNSSTGWWPGGAPTPSRPGSTSSGKPGPTM